MASVVEVETEIEIVLEGCMRESDALKRPQEMVDL